MKITRAQLEAQRPQLPVGFVDEFISNATPCHGVWLVMPAEDYAALRQKYWPNPPAPKISKHFRGAGDVLAAVLHPVVSVVRAATGIDLENCGGCGKRKDKLNQIMPLP